MSGGDEGRRWVRGAGHHHLRVLVVLALGVACHPHPIHVGWLGLLFFLFFPLTKLPPARPVCVV